MRLPPMPGSDRVLRGPSGRDRPNFHVGDMLPGILPDTLPVLLYDEGGLVYAHALELDLVAHAATDREALEALSGVILGQYAAAQHFDDPSLIPFRADRTVIERFARARDRLLRRLPPQGDRTASLPIPSERAIAEYAQSFATCPRP